MKTRHSFQADSLCNSTYAAPSNPMGDESRMAVGVRSRFTRARPSSLLIAVAMRISRARWFSFLRRVFHYQNGSRSDLGSNPFNSSTWMMLEFLALAIQITIITFTLAISQRERPVWPMRLCIVGNDNGCVLNLLLLCGRYHYVHMNLGDGFGLSDLEQQRRNEESRSTHLMNKCRTSLELFFAIWFVMGNVWVFDSWFGSFHHTPNLHILCISLLAWNALSYSFPFLLFLFLCCLVPLISSLLGYNMNMASTEKGAFDDQISQLPSWIYKAVNNDVDVGNEVDCIPTHEIDDDLYGVKEEVRQLPCCHIFHLKRVDQWLRLISSCPE
ncbi:hypothetical protein SLEP1_g20106 [Rubroshorea leprosula]|uniref:Uncharacterized protein n=1 Tax=Rubroshorea leprosula TaxID=152421 RepID=A0AAV5JDJ9_9ROSI|nr:hypothetical protein SLEP1_g20106 [Rubroshorea leprosula]